MPKAFAEASAAIHLRTFVALAPAQSLPKLTGRQAPVTRALVGCLPDRPASVTHHLPPVAAQHVLLRTRLPGTTHAAKPLPALAQAFSDLAATITRLGNALPGEYHALAKTGLPALVSHICTVHDWQIQYAWRIE